MASVTPRISALWRDDYFAEQMGNPEDVEQQDEDGRTPLDKTIDRIGMGRYQRTLLALCGFGWLADNMWIQTIAIILPRVQLHYDVPDNYIGYLSSSMFAGMMIGAIGWGSCSDLLGRSTAFNLTLFFTAIFGLLASYAPSYSSLCIALFFLGTSVGGSMPTDGTLLLEHMPQGKKYLVTALSVFFSFGSVLAAVVGIFVIPPYSCPAPSPGQPPCDIQTSNQGWKYLLMSVGFITLSFFLARIVFFRLHESPRFLVHAGRPEEALLSLQKISRFNGSELSLTLHDVDDRRPATPTMQDEERQPFVQPKTRSPRPDVRVLFDAGQEDFVLESSETEPLSSEAQLSGLENRLASSSPERVHYDSTGSSNTPLGSHSFATPASENPPPLRVSFSRNASTRSQTFLSTEVSPGSDDEEAEDEGKVPGRIARPRMQRSSPSRRSSLYEAKVRVCWALPRWIRKPVWAWLDRVSLVLSPEWLKTTLLVWAMWGCMALAYTMFNVFLPKMLEMHPGGAVPDDSNPTNLESTMWDVVIFTIGGCPGAILGAYMVESSLGRRWSLAGSTFATAVFCIAFVFAESSWAIRTSSIAISLTSTTMWAVLYGWTPEIFETSVRGTACGTASALSRIGGMIAPVLGGAMLVVSRSLPVYISAIIFVLAGLCTLLLRVEDTNRAEGGAVMAH